MSKDFDSERVAEIDASAREFTIGGEQFTIRVATAPEVYVAYYDALRISSTPSQLDLAAKVLGEIADGAEKPADAAQKAMAEMIAMGVRNDLSNTQFLARLDETVLALIDPDQADRWKRVREQADPPITLRAIREVVDYCMEVQSGRPPTQVSSSSNGSGDATSGPPSTDESDLREVQGSPA
jgi:hypothetical protein